MSNTFDVITPVDGSVYATREYTADAAIENAISSAQNAQSKWRHVPMQQRAEICLSAIKHLLNKQEILSEELSWQMGRPIRYCGGEIKGFAERGESMIDTALQKLVTLQQPQRDGFKRFIQRVPLGLVLNMVPWNYPYLTAVNLIIPALMAGNAVLLKPSSQTPLTGERMLEAFTDAGLEPGLLQLLLLSHENSLRLIQHSAINYVAFTGSVAGGAAVEQAASGRFIGLGLELGGNDPAYVRADADLPSTVENLVDGVFFNSGQSCCGIERIYVDADCYDEFVDRFVGLSNAYELGDPLSPQTTLGPMVSSKAADRVRHHCDEAIAKGAQALIDQSAFAHHSVSGPYLAPQVLVNVSHEMLVMREESFGPVVGIMKVQGDDEALALMNDSQYGLTASIWTKDEAAAIHLGEKIDTGTVFMNRCDYLDPELAWNGVKQSGRGCTLSEVGYEMLTRPKSFHLRR